MSLAFDVAATFGDADTTFTVAADLTVEDGETLVFLGPSGSGKTLLLELVAGFHPCEGSVAVGGEDVTDAPPEERELGLVFQEYALFPHMTVRENVAFGARYHEDVRDPDELLEVVDVPDLAERSPPTLSGGEKQRVALARALAIRPQAFLLDEPLSALDAPTREALRGDLVDLLADETAIYVTHDRTTARALADRIAVIHDGRVEQVGTVEEIFERPESGFVAQFTGSNVLRATEVPFDLPADTVAVRPEHVEIDPPEPAATGEVVRVVREDAVYRVTLRVGDAALDAFATEPPGAAEVGIAVPSVRCHATSK